MNYLKIGGLVAVVLLVLGVIWHFHGVEEKKDVLIANNAKQEVVIEAQDQTIKSGEVIADVKEQTGANVAEEVGKNVQAQKKVTQKGEKRESDINHRFEPLPKTPENIEEKQQQLSSSRIDELWDSYCIGVPNAQECKVTPQGA